MKTKVILTIEGADFELQSDCLMNWDEIQCTYMRSDYGGVVRSLSSKFEFVNDAYKLLLDAFLCHGVQTSAYVSIFTLNNDWTWSKQFESAINFSTAEWDEYVFTVNCFDDSLAALIKARKGTKYEFEIGTDIVSGNTLKYDRIKMLNTVTHHIVGRATLANGTTELFNYRALLSGGSEYIRLPTYILNNDEMYEGNSVKVNDQTDDSGAAFLTVQADLDELIIKTDVQIDYMYNKIKVVLFEFDAEHPKLDSTYTEIGTVLTFDPAEIKERRCVCEKNSFGEIIPYNSLDELKSDFPGAPSNSWAGVGYRTASEGYYPGITSPVAKAYFAPVTNDPEGAQWCEGVLDVYYTDYHPQFYCMSQRCIKIFRIRNVPAGKRYALFYKCDGEGELVIHPMIKSTITSQWISRGPSVDIQAITPMELLKSLMFKISDGKDISMSFSSHDPRLANTYLFAGESLRGLEKAKIYSSFNDFCDWLETVFGYTYGVNEDSCSLSFKHRSEFFKNEDQGIQIQNAIDPECKVNSSLLCSIVEIGYKKQDYDSGSGRDEWNFSNQYNTGIDVCERKLTLQSSYRADCYGFEFLVQKRVKDGTTDNKADNNVFFALCKKESYLAPNIGEPGEGVSQTNITQLVLDRSAIISGALSNTVFNGIFSPIYCIKANESYLAAMAPSGRLQFASSDGNSDIIINNVFVSADVNLGEKIFGETEMNFVTSDLNLDADFTKLVSVTRGNFIYRGFIKEVEWNYPKPSEIQYTLIVKDIERI